jgi:alpha-1,2-mannosyltransferase
MSATQDVPVGGNLGLSTRGLGHAAGRAATLIVCGVLPALLVAVIVLGSAHDHFAFDFHQFWQGGHDVVNGHSPYPAADSLPTHGGDQLDATEIQQVFRFPYPAPAALAMAPFGLLPFTVAAWIFVLCSLAAVIVALRLLGVADWRCYGIVFASMTTLGALRLGTFTPCLLLGLALAWRYRDRRLVAAATVGCVIGAKVFLWPLLVWLILGRRPATAALALVFATATTIGSWAVLGFAGLGDYPNLLSSLSAAVEGKGWSVVALALSLGLSAGAAKALAVALGCVAFSGVHLAGRRDRDVWLFALAIAAAILFSPIVWLHYFLLLVAPLAIAYPRLSPAWFIPLLFWIWPFQETGGDTWKITLGVALLAGVTAAALTAPPRGGTTAPELSH